MNHFHTNPRKRFHFNPVEFLLIILTTILTTLGGVPRRELRGLGASEVLKYSVQGLLLLVPPFITATGIALWLHTVNHDIPSTTVHNWCLAGALVILVIDWTLIVAFRKHHKGLAVLGLLVRVSVTTVLSAIAALPFTLAIFGGQLDQMIRDSKTTKLKVVAVDEQQQRESLREARLPLTKAQEDRREALSQQMRAVQVRLDALDEEIARVRTRYLDEGQGSGPSRKEGFKAIAAKIKEELDLLEARRPQILAELNQASSQWQLSVHDGKQVEEGFLSSADAEALREEMARRRQEIEGEDTSGLSFRMDLLNGLCSRSPSTNKLRWLMMAGLMILDMSVLLVKILTPRGAWDRAQELLELRDKARHKAVVDSLPEFTVEQVKIDNARFLELDELRASMDVALAHVDAAGEFSSELVTRETRARLAVTRGLRSARHLFNEEDFHKLSELVDEAFSNGRARAKSIMDQTWAVPTGFAG